MTLRTLLLAGLALALAAPALAQTAPAANADQPLLGKDVNPTPIPPGARAGDAVGMTPGAQAQRVAPMAEAVSPTGDRVPLVAPADPAASTPPQPPQPR